jgi:hypothetical protein
VPTRRKTEKIAVDGGEFDGLHVVTTKPSSWWTVIDRMIARIPPNDLHFTVACACIIAVLCLAPEWPPQLSFMAIATIGVMLLVVVWAGRNRNTQRR